MALIEPDRAYPDEARYWAMVRDTIATVFHHEPAEAARLVRDFVRTMADASPQERLLSFHAEPLQVAASLLRLKDDGTDAERQRYRDLARRSGWQRTGQAGQEERSTGVRRTDA